MALFNNITPASMLGGSLTSHEIEVLEMFAGKRKMEQGAWVNAAAEFLQETGYLALPRYNLTQKGKAFLNRRLANEPADTTAGVSGAG